MPTADARYRPLTGLVDYGEKVFMIAQWESVTDPVPFRFQLLSFEKDDGTLATSTEIDPDAIGKDRISPWPTYDEDRALLFGDDLSIGARLLDRGASAHRREPVLIGNMLWFGYSGKLIAWNLDTGAQTVEVGGADSETQGTYYTPLCALGDNLLCVYERVKGQINTHDYLDYAGTVATWYLNMIEAEPEAAPEEFPHWLTEVGGIAFELGLCTIDSAGVTIEEEVFPDTEVRGYAPSGNEELIRNASASEVATASGGPIGGVYEGRVAWESQAAPTPPYELEPSISATTYTDLLPALGAGEAQQRVVQWAEIPSADISFTTGPFAAQNEVDLIWPSAINSTPFIGIEGEQYYKSDFTAPSYTYGSRPTSVGARVSETDPPPTPDTPTIKLRQWVRRPKALYTLEQTKPPSHSLLDFCSVELETGPLAIFGPRRDYEGTNFNWNTADGFVWTAYNEDLTEAWSVSIDGMAGTRRQSRPIVAGGRIWTVIQAFDVDAQIVEISLAGEILRQTTLESLGITWDDIETETDFFELTSDGNAIYLRANTKLWKVAFRA